MAAVTITTVAEGLTVERIVHKQMDRYVPGAVEATLDQNRGLAANPALLPSGTRVTVSKPDPMASAVEVIRLGD